MKDLNNGYTDKMSYMDKIFSWFMYTATAFLL